LLDSPTGRKIVKLVKCLPGGDMYRVDPHLAAENVRVDKATSEFIKSFE
jgi:hypothetical protein